jgi:hypothetical protein
MEACIGEPLLYPPHMLEEVARERRETALRIKLQLLSLTHRCADDSSAERRADAAERRAETAEQSAERADQTRRAAEAEQRAAKAERHANASVATRPIIVRPSQPKPIIAPAPNGRLTKEVEVMSTRKLALLREAESASFRLESARQGLENAKFLARNGMASDVVFATHVLAGAVNNRNRACAAYLSFKG